MTMVAGRLDQRVSFWAREDAGADGFVRPVFVYMGTYWGRIDHTAQTQNVGTEPQAEINYRSPARATVADYVDVPLNGLLKLEGDPTAYWVRGVITQRQLRSQRIDLEVMTPLETIEFVEFEGLPITDGVHLVTTAEFSTAFDEAFA
jgi:hypothetical protein